MNCDQIARWYRWLEYAAFGRALERRRFAFLGQVADARRVLVLGDGDGRFLAQLIERNRRASVDYVDSSREMLELARMRAGTDRVAYLHGDALTIPLPAAGYDLVVTHFFLDCLNADDARALIPRVAASLKPDARWLISEFREPAWWAHAIVAVLYAFFRIAAGLRVCRLIDHRPLLANAGFALLREETALAGLLASELWARATIDPE